MAKTAKGSVARAKGDGKQVPGDGRMLPHDLLLMPAAQNAAAILSWSSQFGEPDINRLVLELRDRIKAVQDGDMQLIEGMLYGQATALQSIFTNLTRRAAATEGLTQFTTMMTLGLKAQAQCRCTLEALAEIKNPRPVAFVKQANIAQGPQQVNNGPAPAEPHTRTGKDGTGQNRLLEATHEQWLDTRAQGAAGGANSVLETVGTVERAANR